MPWSSKALISLDVAKISEIIKNICMSTKDLFKETKEYGDYAL